MEAEMQMELFYNVCDVHVSQLDGETTDHASEVCSDRHRLLFVLKLTLNDLCGGTARSVAFEGCVSIARLLQQVTQLLTGL